MLSGRKPNKDLTPDERKRKQALKRELKAKRKRAKLEARLRHAISRKDKVVEQETRELLKKAHQISILGTEKKAVQDSADAIAAHAFISDLYRRLKEKQKAGLGSDSCSQFSKTTKAMQTNDAVQLLRHMTKGTQVKEMFGNKDALWGYTRQKFQERALLVYTSLAKLQPGKKNISLEVDVLQRRVRAWNAIKEIKTVCSIGCGPGCDAIGVVALLRTLEKHSEQDRDEKKMDEIFERKVLESVFLFDWAMDQWATIVNILKDLIVPSLVKRIHCSSCDITKSFLRDDYNYEIRKIMYHSTDETIFNNIHEDEESNYVERRNAVDLYLLSYILTETRDKWHAFWNELVDKAKPNALFYIAEPTPWQLHQLILKEEQRANTRCSLDDKFRTTRRLEFIWLDSSMDLPLSLQALNGRLGPGVLLARKLE